MAKLNFTPAITQFFSVIWTFILICWFWFLRNISYYYQCWKQLLLNIFVKTMIHFVRICLGKEKRKRFLLQCGKKNSYWFYIHIVNDLCLQLQLKSLFSTVLNSTRKTPSQLDSSTFVALGHIVCGIDAPVMRNLNPVELRLNYLKKNIEIIWII